MKHKLIAILIAVSLLMALIPVSLQAAPKPPDYVPYDAGPEIRGWEATADRITGSLAEANAEPAAATTSINSCTLDTKIWLRLNAVTGGYGLATYHLVAEGSLTQIWVQTDLAWPAGDPRPTPEITCEQTQYMLGQFEEAIYPKEIAFFGSPDAHNGAAAYLPGLVGLPADYYADSAGRQVVLVSNVRDENYFDPTYPTYIAGFYSPSYEIYFDRNVMTIDAYDWMNRTGPNGTRPYLYEGVFAHEYQHLLHDDYDSDEENFVNEGMADLAEYLTGYGIAVKGHVDFSSTHPENSLTVWEDQGDLEILADYGHAYLFQYYLMEQLGKPFIQALFHNPDNGITGVNTTLTTTGKQTTFADLYHDWSVAALINSKTPGGAKFQFWNVDTTLSYYFAPFNIGTPTAPNPEAFSTLGAPPWGTDYIWIPGDPKALGKFTFNGLDYSTFPTAWTSDGNVLWGGAGDLIDNWAIFQTTGGGTLTFDTKYDIEALWDFGFVQVSTDGGYTWTSLANAYTTSDHDPNAHPKVIANLPGLTGTTGGAWVSMSYDLSAYAGQPILVAFRYVTDWATAEPGWFVDNVYVDGTLISDGSDASVFKDITEIIPINNDFTVTFVGMKAKGQGNEYKALTMKLNGVTEDGLFELNKVLKWSDQAAMLVTFDAPEGFTGYADYTYDFSFTNKGPKK